MSLLQKKISGRTGGQKYAADQQNDAAALFWRAVEQTTSQGRILACSRISAISSLQAFAIAGHGWSQRAIDHRGRLALVSLSSKLQ